MRAKAAQFSFRADSGLLAELRDVAGNVDRSVAWVVSRFAQAGVRRWRAGDRRDLARESGGAARISAETAAQLETALALVLERAPSPVVEDLARRLTRLAGQYGDEREPSRARSRR